MVKKKTGKTIAQHAFESLNKEDLQHSYFPSSTNSSEKNLVKTINIKH